MSISIIENIKKMREALRPSSLAKGGARFLERYIRTFTFIVILALVSYCIYLWFSVIYRPEWSENQKQAYIKSKGQGTVFNEKGFAYDVATIKARNDESQRDLGTLVDIFRLKKYSASVLSTSPGVPSIQITPSYTNTSSSAGTGKLP